jgi:hypothetical protein
MEYIAEAELSFNEQAIYHSFAPEPYPGNVSQVPRTEDEKQKWRAASGEDGKCSALPKTRRYLPCHYFDYIGGSSTGA